MRGIECTLVDVMGNDLSTVNSARVSFNKESSFEYELNEEGFVVDEVLSEADTKLIKYLAKHKHMTPFRHNGITLRCKSPIFLARQLGKHQAGLSWNEVSRRYVDDTPEFFTTDWRERPDGSIKQGSGGVVKKNKMWRDYYSQHLHASLSLYEDLIMDGVAPELARMVLPQSMLTEWIWTGNLISFAHVYKERIASGAQLEAQEFAKELDKIIRPLFPVSWSALVDI
jgi:thymidylate synthase (FAD)